MKISWITGVLLPNNFKNSKSENLNSILKKNVFYSRLNVKDSTGKAESQIEMLERFGYPPNVTIVAHTCRKKRKKSLGYPF